MRNVISLVVLLCSFTSADTQPTLDKVIDKYFRVNPLNRPFHLFLSQVINDTAFTIARLEKRTDTSLFYMQGNYKNFNPFSFKTQVVQLIIADYIVKDDSSQKNIDTLITCRISATTLPAAGKYQKEQVRNEYKVFTRKNQRLFIYKIDSSHTSPDTKQLDWEVMDFYANASWYIPFLTVNWGRVLGKENYVFSMQLIVKMVGSELFLPVPPDRL